MHKLMKIIIKTVMKITVLFYILCYNFNKQQKAK